METSGKPQGLAFGTERLAEAVYDRLTQSLSTDGPQSEPALVVGVFGEWGCGKSTLLAAINGQMSRTLKDRQGVDRPPSYTVPIWFNAWRYEREEHLIIPLLKVAQIEVKKALQDSAKLEDKFKDVLDAKSELLADLTYAAAHALGESVKLHTPVGEIKLDVPLKWWEFFKKRRESRKDEAKTDIDRLKSLQYEFQQYMRALTGREGALFKQELKQYQFRKQRNKWDPDKESVPFQLNLVFLIDDLDRCLPDKAVEILEAIKLFLEVDGCAFVLALDDEVIERGIAHRYRDYLFQANREAKNGDAPAQSAPITGTEYLEKIIQLPLRLTRPSRSQVDLFLREQYSGWCAAPSASEKKPEEKSTHGLVADPKHSSRKRTAEPSAAAVHPADTLRELIKTVVPPVPRKLVRVMELMRTYENVLIRRKVSVDRQYLAIFVCLQLFSPELYRFLRVRGAGYLGEMAKWEEDNEFRDLDALKVKFEKEMKDAPEKAGHVDRENRARLPQLIKSVQMNRSGFELASLLRAYSRLGTGGAERDATMQNYFVLFSEEDLKSAATGNVAEEGGMPPPPLSPELVVQPREGKPTTSPETNPSASAESYPELEVAIPPRDTPTVNLETGNVPGWISAEQMFAKRNPNLYRRPDAGLENAEAFVDNLLSDDSRAWANALAREAPALAGTVLSETTVERLVAGLSRRFDSSLPPTPENLLRLVRTIEPYLTPERAGRFAEVLECSMPKQGAEKK